MPRTNNSWFKLQFFFFKCNNKDPQLFEKLGFYYAFVIMSNNYVRN